MDEQDYKRNACSMIYLTVCAVNGKTPEYEKIESLDLERLFEVCQEHILTACTAYALESAGIKHHEFTQAKEKAIRKNILLDTERKKILNRLEQEQIWYMPLKGAILKEWYPKLGMRQMSDNDILCDGNFRKRIKKIMLDIGFTCEHFGEGHHDAYFKKPVCNFEIHNELFDDADGKNLHDYYENVKDRLIKDEGNKCGYHFTTEDFYIYITAHEYKHYSKGGTGVRSLLDTYIFMRKFGDSLDWKHISTELEKLGISDFERQSRELAVALFCEKELTEAQEKMLDYYIFSGTYGTIENSVENRIQTTAQGSKKQYILQRAFPPLEHYKIWYPWAYKHKVLLPAAWVFRMVRGVTARRKKISAEFKYLEKRNKS